MTPLLKHESSVFRTIDWIIGECDLFLTGRQWLAALGMFLISHWQGTIASMYVRMSDTCGARQVYYFECQEK